MKVDNNATAKNVRTFFKQGMDSYLAFAGQRRVDIKQAVENDLEFNRVTDLASQVVYCVVHALKDCSSFSQQIIISRYLDKLQAWRLAQRLGYGLSRMGQLTQQALVEFAIQFHHYALQIGLANDGMVTYKAS